MPAKPKPKTVTKVRLKSVMKAYRIGRHGEDYFVAAANEPQAVGTLMAHLEEDDAKTLGRCQEVEPRKIVVHFEQNDGKYQKGNLGEIMPSDDVPDVLIDPNYP